MSSELSAAIQAIAGFLSVVVALIALAIAIRSEQRSIKRFEEEQNISQKIAAANIKPVLSVYKGRYIDAKGIYLVNYGMGTAVITSICFSKANVETKNIATLFQFEEDVIWDTYWKFDDKTSYLCSEEERVLVKLTAENLARQGHSDQSSLQILENWQSQVKGIRIQIFYEDVLGNKQTPIDAVLTG